jgi:hypothetical protein
VPWKAPQPKQNLISREDTASERRDCSAGASVHAAGARSLYARKL